MQIPILICRLKTDKPLKKSQTPFLRGYILNKFGKEDYVELHNHSGMVFSIHIQKYSIRLLVEMLF